MIIKDEVSSTDKVCGNCLSASLVTIRELSGMIWCETGQAARRSGMTACRAVYVNPKRVACEAFRLRVEPLKAESEIPDSIESAESAEQKPAEMIKDGKPDDVAPEVTRTEQEEPPFYFGDAENAGVPGEIPDNRQLVAARRDKTQANSSHPDSVSRTLSADAFL